MNNSVLDSSEKAVRQIVNLPLFLTNLYIGLSLAIFVISPLFPEARDAYWAIAYGVAAMLCFSFGYSWAAGRAMKSSARANPKKLVLNIAIIAMCTANMIYFLPMLKMATSYYGFNSIFDVFTDIGQNYRAKGKLMDEIGSGFLGPFYTILNILFFSQICPYALLLFYREKITPVSYIFVIISGIVTTLFYMAIGTMSGLFYIVTLIGAGWLARQYLFFDENTSSIQIASNKRKRVITILASTGAFFFVFMIIALSSRLDRDINITLPLLYKYDSPIYQILGRRLGDGFGLALSYISQGWYGLGNSLDIDFQWTGGHSFSRVLDSYLIRFSNDDTGLPPLSYPVRQEAMTGYPAFAYWHTIFPWFASDFTFAGTLVITGLFGAVYGKVWVTAIREGCPINASLFALLSIGALFMNANSQILDSKQLTLALLGLLFLSIFRKQISSIS